MYTSGDNLLLRRNSTVQSHVSDLRSSIPGHRRSDIQKLFYVIAAAAGRRHDLDTKVWCTINTFFDKSVELADYGNVRLDHCAVVTVELHIKRGRKDFTCTFVIADIQLKLEKQFTDQFLVYRARCFQKDQMPVDEFSTNIVREGIVVVQSVFALFLI